MQVQFCVPAASGQASIAARRRAISMHAYKVASLYRHNAPSSSPPSARPRPRPPKQAADFRFVRFPIFWVAVAGIGSGVLVSGASSVERWHFCGLVARGLCCCCVLLCGMQGVDFWHAACGVRCSLWLLGRFHNSYAQRTQDFFFYTFHYILH